MKRPSSTQRTNTTTNNGSEHIFFLLFPKESQSWIYYQLTKTKSLKVYKFDLLWRSPLLLMLNWVRIWMEKVCWQEQRSWSSPPTLGLLYVLEIPVPIAGDFIRESEESHNCKRFERFPSVVIHGTIVFEVHPSCMGRWTVGSKYPSLEWSDYVGTETQGWALAERRLYDWYEILHKAQTSFGIASNLWNQQGSTKFSTSTIF